MDLRSTFRLAVCALAFAALPAGAALYKWIDENGRVVYGDTPPPGVKAERVNAAAPPGDPDAVRDMANREMQLKKRQQERADEQTKAEKAAADAKGKLERCVQIRGRLQGLRSDALLYRFNEKGEKVYLDAAEREKSIADSEKLLRDLTCPAAPSG